MPVGAPARRYAQALFDLARERGALDTWLEDLRLAASALREPGVRGVLDAPQVALGEKEAVLRASLRGLDPAVQNTVVLLLRRQRLDRIGDVIADYERLADEARGIARAQLTTAVELADAEAERLRALLAQTLRQEVRLSKDVDSRLIGGAVLRVGDRLLDGSIATRLQMLRRVLADAAVQR